MGAPRIVRSGADRQRHGALRDALHAAASGAAHTPQTMAEAVGSTPEIVRASCRRYHIPLVAMKRPIEWTAPMRARLLVGVKAGEPIELMAEALGVSAPAMLRGMAQIIREMVP